MSTTTEQPPALLSPRAAAAYLAISRATLYRLLDMGKLPKPVTPTGLKRAPRYRRSDLDRYAANLKTRRS